MNKTILISIIIAVIVVVIAILRDQLPKLYKRRNCQGIYWCRKYPDISKEEIKKFLQIFIDAFAFKEKHRCQFKPNDKVMDVYSALYPAGLSKLSGDAMELEEFAISLEKEYKIDFDKIWNEDITLGQIFETIIKKKSPTKKSR